VVDSRPWWAISCRLIINALGGEGVVLGQYAETVTASARLSVRGGIRGHASIMELDLVHRTCGNSIFGVGLDVPNTGLEGETL
jgi:hypothetical protein